MGRTFSPRPLLWNVARCGLGLVLWACSLTSASAVEFVPPRKAASLQPRPLTSSTAKADPCAKGGEHEVSANWREAPQQTAQAQPVSQVDRNWRVRGQDAQFTGNPVLSRSAGSNLERPTAALTARPQTARRVVSGTATAQPPSQSTTVSRPVVPAAMVERPATGVATAIFRDVSLPQVKLTAHQNAANPFDDPFGDRREPLEVPSVSLQPPSTNGASGGLSRPETRPAMEDGAPEPPPADLDSPSATGDPQPGRSATDPLVRPAPNSTGESDDAPVPPPEPAPRMEDGDSPAPAPSAGDWEPLAEPKDSCKRVYNGRDCCTEDELCAAHRKRVNEVRIDMISLDITPRMTVTQLDSPVDQSPDEYLQELADELRKAPARIWRDRSGKQVADGRMTNFQLGRVEIQTEREVVKVPFADLSDDDMCFVTAWWNIPSECVIADGPFKRRAWTPATLTWRASALCHKPLYFEDVRLERYGHSAGVMQPFYSGAHFFVSVAALPYNMALYPPYECRYPRGYYRPGDCAPWLVPPIPLSGRAALSATGFYLGLGYLIP